MNLVNLSVYARVVQAAVDDVEVKVGPEEDRNPEYDPVGCDDLRYSCGGNFRGEDERIPQGNY